MACAIQLLSFFGEIYDLDQMQGSKCITYKVINQILCVQCFIPSFDLNKAIAPNEIGKLKNSYKQILDLMVRWQNNGDKCLNCIYLLGGKRTQELIRSLTQKMNTQYKFVDRRDNKRLINLRVLFDDELVAFVDYLHNQKICQDEQQVLASIPPSQRADHLTRFLKGASKYKPNQQQDKEFMKNLEELLLEGISEEKIEEKQ